MESNQIKQQLELINSENNAIEIFILAQPEMNNGNIEISFYKARMQENLPDELISLFYPKVEKN